MQVVYLGLAFLFGLGFVGFGVGGGFGGGGIFEGVFGGHEGSSHSSYSGQVSAAEKRTRAHPSEAAGWAALADAQFHEASASEFYDEATQQFTSQGKALLVKVSNSWNHYLELNPRNPDLTVAQEMERVFGAEGLNQPASEVAVLQLVIASKPPSASLYSLLAEYSYEAKNIREGDLAARKAIALAPKVRRPTVKAELERIKKSVVSGTSTAPSSGTATTTTPTGKG